MRSFPPPVSLYVRVVKSATVEKFEEEFMRITENEADSVLVKCDFGTISDTELSNSGYLVAFLLFSYRISDEDEG